MSPLRLKSAVNARPPVLAILHQHLEDAACLRNTRSTLVRAPHVKLRHLGRLDERIAAHLDGIAVAGRAGAQMSMQALDRPGRGELFTAAVGCIEAHAAKTLLQLIALSEAVPAARSGLHSAFGWVSASRLQETVGALLESDDPAAQRAGIAACAQHRVDPKRFLDAAIASQDAAVRARALQCAGETGRIDLLASCIAHLGDEDASCRIHAATAALLLGDRRASLDVLQALALAHADAAADAATAALAASTLPPGDAHALLQRIAAQRDSKRLLIRTVAHAGDPHYIPWLIELMQDDQFARVAGESFSLITGADIAWLDLDRKPPAHWPSGPSDDPNDTDVAMDEDDGAPWPDADKIAQWWRANASRFQSGQRYLCGAPPSRAHCIGVLKDGYQRQRMAAARHLCLLDPGAPLFNCAAPAWRQQRRLAML
ncbi:MULTISPECIES: TIGR02270 family protein [unclassified Caballeronia]|uniref:TIGR02270 family protein n=1 Tax=unclassified Caballeronia TaxID=2646786 RepID=UPI00285BC6EE|nr:MULTISPECIES: TIGR02270 family protein [unclassified Caballeronia]MDR5740972.1 TIGR02270 family protein [Caballeronia sp. LZ016]MDR5806870.1 TIGR02270 family protein [Caballeronia sp. LZ019]